MRRTTNRGGTNRPIPVSVSSCRWQVDTGRRRDGVAIYHPMNRGFQNGNPYADCVDKAGSLAKMQPCPAFPAGAAIPLGLHPQVRFGGQPPQAALGPEMSARTRPTGGLPPPALAVVSKCALRDKKEGGPRFPGDLPAVFNRVLSAFAAGTLPDYQALPPVLPAALFPAQRPPE